MYEQVTFEIKRKMSSEEEKKKKVQWWRRIFVFRPFHHLNLLSFLSLLVPTFLLHWVWHWLLLYDIISVNVQNLVDKLYSSFTFYSPFFFLASFTLLLSWRNISWNYFTHFYSSHLIIPPFNSQVDNEYEKLTLNCKLLLDINEYKH